jgi:GNAT superfamily N-acetyltransferase
MTLNMPIEVHPATSDRWHDLVAILHPSDSQQCWCLYWRLSSSAYSKAGLEQRERLVRERISHPPAPGMLAYVDGRPIGWCGLGPRTEFERLARSRTIPAIDDRPVWSIVCFLVQTGFRRRGVGKALLLGAIDYARAEGAVGLEAYPVDTGGRRIQTTAAYVGTTAMFEAAGFRRIVATDARSDWLPRWLMRLDLDGGTAPRTKRDE